MLRMATINTHPSQHRQFAPRGRGGRGALHGRGRAAHHYVPQPGPSHAHGNKRHTTTKPEAGKHRNLTLTINNDNASTAGAAETAEKSSDVDPQSQALEVTPVIEVAPTRVQPGSMNLDEDQTMAISAVSPGSNEAASMLTSSAKESLAPIPDLPLPMTAPTILQPVLASATAQSIASTDALVSIPSTSNCRRMDPVHPAGSSSESEEGEISDDGAPPNAAFVATELAKQTALQLAQSVEKGQRAAFPSRHRKLVRGAPPQANAANSSQGKEVVVNGVTFVSDATGRKLVRKDCKVSVIYNMSLCVSLSTTLI